VRRSSVALAFLSVFVVACASGGKQHSDNPTKPSASKSKSSTDQSRLTQDEITAANLPTAYDLVDRLRRPWLRRDAVTGGDVAIYMDERNIGGATALRDIPSVDVQEMQYLRNDEAVRRWGADVKGSVIVVTRRR
jgi:hypothetical protein